MLILAIEKQGQVKDVSHLESLADELKADGYSHAVVGKVEFITHWWAVETTEGRVMYFGTPESFGQWKERLVQ